MTEFVKIGSAVAALIILIALMIGVPKFGAGPEHQKIVLNGESIHELVELPDGVISQVEGNRDWLGRLDTRVIDAEMSLDDMDHRINELARAGHFTANGGMLVADMAKDCDARLTTVEGILDELQGTK